MKAMRIILFSAAAAATMAITTNAVLAQQPVPRFEQEVKVEGAKVVGSASDYYLTFSAPIALPGVSLGPGTYVFRKEASGLLRVLNAGREQTFLLAFTAPIQRTADMDKYEVRFIEPLAEGAPHRIVAWFSPGSSIGQELLYRPLDLGDAEK
jgi:hypothetical protein